MGFSLSITKRDESENHTRNGSRLSVSSSYINEQRSSNMGSVHSLLDFNYIQDFDLQQNERGYHIKTDV